MSLKGPQDRSDQIHSKRNTKGTSVWRDSNAKARWTVSRLGLTLARRDHQVEDPVTGPLDLSHQLGFSQPRPCIRAQVAEQMTERLRLL